MNVHAFPPRPTHAARALSFQTLSRLVFAGLALALFAGGCKKKEVTSLDRAHATQLATEAQGSLLLRDYAAAVKALEKAVELDPEVVGYWSALGANRARLGDKSGARKAYKRLLEIHEKAFKKDPKNIDALLNQVEPLVLLGRADDARKLIEKATRDFPTSREARAALDGKLVDRILEDPAVKAAMAP